MVEVAAHKECVHWTMVPRSFLPVGAKTIRFIWWFKRKRFPDGSLKKHKARICAHGGMQHWGENYWENYSSVVNMLRVGLLLSIAQIHGLNLRSINFVLAFPQADIDIDIRMELPVGDESNRCLYVLKPNKTSSRWKISYLTQGSKQMVNSDIQLRGSVTIQKTINFYECFGYNCQNY